MKADRYMDKYMYKIQWQVYKLCHCQSEPLTMAQATVVKLGDNLKVKCQQISTKIKE